MLCLFGDLMCFVISLRSVRERQEERNLISSVDQSSVTWEAPKHNEKEEVSKRKLAAMTRIHRATRTDINRRQIERGTLWSLLIPLTLQDPVSLGNSPLKEHLQRTQHGCSTEKDMKMPAPRPNAVLFSSKDHIHLGEAKVNIWNMPFFKLDLNETKLAV